MKKFLLLVCLPLLADIPYSIPTYCLCDFGAGCSAFAEFLYWKPYAPSRPQQPTPSYACGFRVGAHLGSVNHLNFLEGDYTQFDWAKGGRARRVFKYRSGSLVGGRAILCRHFVIAPFVGGRSVVLEESHALDSFKQQITFQGGGGELGVDMQSPRFCGFFGAGRVSFVGIVGKRQDHSRQPKQKVESHTICVPGILVRIGVGYLQNMRQMRISGEVGYELDTYFRPIEGTLYRQPAPYLRTTRFNLGFGGLYVQLKVRY